MKKIVTLLIAVLLTISIASCAQESTELTSTNILDYINVQLVFGNTEQHTKEGWSLGILDDEETKEDIYTSCMCYIIISPKADYKFENASLNLTLEQIGLISTKKWTVNVYGSHENIYTDSFTIYLDSRGYGITSVQLTRNTDNDHPINYNFETSVSSATGSVYEAK